MDFLVGKIGLYVPITRGNGFYIEIQEHAGNWKIAGS
jgi:hypothetical protein